MSLLGKVLAVLNILGAIALVALGSMAFTKRQVGSYSVFLAQLVIDGLPVDEEESTAKGQPIHELIGDKLKADLFSQAGGFPVTTQVAEVQRLTSELRSGAEGNQDKRERMLYQVRVLLPLTDFADQRENLLIYRTHLATAQSAKQLEDRYKAAFAETIGPRMTERVKESGLEVAFRHALKDQGGEPSGPFATAFLRALPPEEDKARAANFDATFAKAREALAADVDKRFNDLFEEVKPSTPPPGRTAPLYTPAQRRGIVRLLVGIVPFRAEEEVFSPRAEAKDKELVTGLTRDSLAAQQKLPSTRAYEKAFLRAQVVVGLQAIVEAVSRRAVALQQIHLKLNELALQERADFIRDHRILLDHVRNQASLLEADTRLLANEQELLRRQTAVVARRTQDVATYEGEVKDARAKVTEDFERVQERGRKLFALRLEVRDAQVTNQKLADAIRRRENQIRELEADEPAKRAPRP